MAKRGYRPAIWLSMESLKEKKRYYNILSSSSKDSTPESGHLSTCIGNVRLKLAEYFQKIGDLHVYIAACILSPKIKGKFFEKR